MLGHGRSRPPTHTLTSLSPTDPMHTLPLTTLLALCRAVRSVASTSILLEQNFLIVRSLPARAGLTVMEAAHFSAVQSHRGKYGSMSAALWRRGCRVCTRAVYRLSRGRSAAHLHS